MTFRGAQRVSLEARRKKAKEKMMLSQAYVYMPSGTVVWELTFPQLYEQKVLCSCFMHCVIWRSRKAFAVLDGSNMISQGLKDTSQSKNNLLKQPISAITIFWCQPCSVWNNTGHMLATCACGVRQKSTSGWPVTSHCTAQKSHLLLNNVSFASSLRVCKIKHLQRISLIHGGLSSLTSKATSSARDYCMNISPAKE